MSLAEFSHRGVCLEGVEISREHVSLDFTNADNNLTSVLDNAVEPGSTAVPGNCGGIWLVLLGNHQSYDQKG